MLDLCTIVQHMNYSIHASAISVMLTFSLLSFPEGQLEVLKENKVLGTMTAGRTFGELALLYNCNRTASVRGNYRFILY